MKTKKMIFSIMLTLTLLVISPAINSQTSIQSFAPKPPLGFNSFDSYRSNLTEEKAYALRDVMAEKYLPFGYEYFVMDAGWYTTITNREVTLTQQDLRFVAFEESYNLTVARQNFQLKDIWSGETIIIKDKYTFTLPAEGVAFFKFQMQ